MLQMISLMDNLLKRENLDMRLSPYKVLPTGESHKYIMISHSRSWNWCSHLTGELFLTFECLIVDKFD